MLHFPAPASYTGESVVEFHGHGGPSVLRLVIAEVPAQRRAAIRFSGWWSDALFRQHDATLQAWLKRNGLTPSGPPLFAYYNDPFTPGFLRRNEILYALGDQK